MTAYILASDENISVAKELLTGYSNINIVSDGSLSLYNVRKRIENAFVILTIIDEKFTQDEMLNNELEQICNLLKTERNKIFIPIIIGNVEIPIFLKYTRCIVGESLEKASIDNIKTQVKIRISYEKSLTKRMQKSRVYKSSYMIVLTLAIEIFAFIWAFIYYYGKKYNFGYDDEQEVVLMSMVILISFIAITALMMSYFSVMRRRRYEDEEKELEGYSNRLKRAIVTDDNGEVYKHNVNDNNKQEIDALGRMMINLEDIKEFYTWSQKQAKASFVLAVSMCIVGFLLMTASVALPIIYNLSFEMSIIPAIGGVITELIAGTALVVYKSSLGQLNHYHKALHEDERFLSSVNLLGKFKNPEAQDEMLREIIRSEIQMNLFIQKESREINKNDNS